MNIEAFNNEQDIGAPLNIEGFEDANNCALESAQSCTKYDNCTLMGDSCVAKTPENDVPSTGNSTDAKEADHSLSEPSGAHSEPQYSAPQSHADFCKQVKQCSPPTENFSDYDYENFNGEESTDVVADEPANNSSEQLVNVDLLLRSLVYGCVFYILAHPESLALVKKCCQQVVKKISGDNVLLVQMGLFVVVYYLLSLFI